MKLTLLLLTAGAVLAQDSKPTLTCEKRGSRERGGRFCEVREQTIPYAGLLNIDGRQNGGVSVKGWNRSDVLVRAMVEARGTDDGDAQALASQVRINTAAGRIAADGPESQNQRQWYVSYEVFTPQQTNLEVKTHNGGVHLTDLRGNIQFSAVNGGIHLARVNGRVKGETKNGGVHVQLAGSRWEGEGLDLTTTNGGVHLDVPASYSAQLETSTVNGGFKSDFPMPTGVEKQRQVKASLGSGGAPLRIATTNGGVQIRKI